MYQVFVATFIMVAMPLAAKVRDPVVAVPASLKVTPEAAAIVVVPVATTNIVVPTANGTAALVGMVNVPEP